MLLPGEGCMGVDLGWKVEVIFLQVSVCCQGWEWGRCWEVRQRMQGLRTR